MAKKRKLRQELSKFAHKTEKPLELISGALGIYIGGKQYVDIPTRPGYVFVRLRNNMSELIQAHNQTVSPIYDLPVLVVWNHNRYEIYGRDSEQYGSYWETSSSFLPKHGFQHEFDPDNNGGGDLVFVHGEQFYPMMTFPSGTDGANTVLIAPYRYFYQGLWRYTGNTGVGDLLALGPTGGNNAKLLLVGVTSATGNPFIKQGSEFSEGITGAAALTQFVPTSLTPIDEIPGAIIRLVTGTETITWANIYDARQYMGILQAGSGTSGVSTFLGLTDTPSSYSGQANKLVVVNSAETALEFRTNTGSFGGGGGGQIGIYGQDEAVGLGTGTTLNVVGNDISLSISGTVLTLLHSDPTGTPHSFLDLTDTPDSYSGQSSKFVSVNSGGTALEFVTAPAGGGGNLIIYDDGVFKATGTSISFDSNLSVVVTGSVAYVASNISAAGTYHGAKIYHSTYETWLNVGQVSGYILQDSEEWDTDNYHFVSNSNLSGTLTLVSGSSVISGSGTAFTSELSIGQVLSVITGTAYYAVASIIDDTRLIAYQIAPNNYSGLVGQRRNSFISIPSGLAGKYHLVGGTYINGTPSQDAPLYIRCTPANGAATNSQIVIGGQFTPYTAQPGGVGGVGHVIGEADLSVGDILGIHLYIDNFGASDTFYVGGGNDISPTWQRGLANWFSLSLAGNSTIIITGSSGISGIVIQDEGITLGTGTAINFVGDNIQATISGSVVTVESYQCGTYQRVGQAVPLISSTGLFWQVPDMIYASGSLAVFNNGLLKYVGTDYAEQLWVSGTYQYTSTPATGTVHWVMYGVPCVTQTQPPTGTAIPTFSLQDSDSVLILDSDNIQLLDSDG